MKANLFGGGRKKKRVDFVGNEELHGFVLEEFGWVVAWVLPSHRGCWLQEYQEKQWVAIGVPLHADFDSHWMLPKSCSALIWGQTHCSLRLHLLIYPDTP